MVRIPDKNFNTTHPSPYVCLLKSSLESATSQTLFGHLSSPFPDKKVFFYFNNKFSKNSTSSNVKHFN